MSFRKIFGEPTVRRSIRSPFQSQEKTDKTVGQRHIRHKTDKFRCLDTTYQLSLNSQHASKEMLFTWSSDCKFSTWWHQNLQSEIWQIPMKYRCHPIIIQWNRWPECQWNSMTLSKSFPIHFQVLRVTALIHQDCGFEVGSYLERTEQIFHCLEMVCCFCLWRVNRRNNRLFGSILEIWIPWQGVWVQDILARDIWDRWQFSGWSDCNFSFLEAGNQLQFDQSPHISSSQMSQFNVIKVGRTIRYGTISRFVEMKSRRISSLICDKIQSDWNQ
jgi:hypothetical protein